MPAVITGSQFDGTDLTGANFEGARRSLFVLAHTSCSCATALHVQMRWSARRTPSACA
jgi:uncharacterized protein YjbI with pentapeptide repeats